MLCSDLRQGRRRRSQAGVGGPGARLAAAPQPRTCQVSNIPTEQSHCCSPSDCCSRVCSEVVRRRKACRASCCAHSACRFSRTPSCWPDALLTAGAHGTRLHPRGEVRVRRRRRGAGGRRAPGGGCVRLDHAGARVRAALPRGARRQLHAGPHGCGAQGAPRALVPGVVEVWGTWPEICLELWGCRACGSAVACLRCQGSASSHGGAEPYLRLLGGARTGSARAPKQRMSTNTSQ